MMDEDRISPDFFKRDPVACARELIGCELVWKGCSGKIVETEAYRTVGDDACHTFFRPSVRKFFAGCNPGDAYVYLNYGVHWLFNIVVKGGEFEGFVLIRALEPTGGIGEMENRRNGLPLRLLAAGPGRLTQALGIGRETHGSTFLMREECGIYFGAPTEPVVGTRIGITKSPELPWRFGERSSKFLSKRFL